MTRSKTLQPKTCYIRASLYTSLSTPSVNLEEYKKAVDSALKQAFGLVGVASLKADILAFNPLTSTAVIEADIDTYTKVWAALTLANRYYAKPARFEVDHVTSCLLTMASPRSTFS